MTEEHKWYPADRLIRLDLECAIFHKSKLIVIQDKKAGITVDLDKPEFTEETLKGLGDIVLRKLTKILEEDKKND
jgi:hypothetical protein